MGVWDRSFLGNTYTGCHTASNGVVANVIPTLVHLSGRLFYVKPGQAAGASTNSPPGSASDNAYWGYARDGGANPAMSIPTWTSGNTVREGGAYWTDSPTARTSSPAAIRRWTRRLRSLARTRSC